MGYQPSDVYFQSALSAAITDTSMVTLRSAVGSGFTPYVKEYCFGNTAAAVDTIIEILSNSQVIWADSASRTGGRCEHVFDGDGLPGVAGGSIQVRAKTTAANIQGGIRGLKLRS